jgi:STE24 endopeptidase
MQDHGTELEERTRKYSSLKYGLSIAETVFFLVFLFIVAYSGAAARLSWLIGSAAKTASPFVIAPFFIALLGLVYYAVTFPLVFYQSFLLEYQFGLSRQSLASWFADQAKSGVLGFVFTVIVIEVLYAIITVSPNYWWLFISAFLIFFNLILAKVAPVLIIPLFYKCSKFQDSNLRIRIEQLAAAMKIKLLDIYKLDFSKKTVKANAGLTGWGATKRVILADTLFEKYTEDEILTILAHEFAHYVGKHLVQLVLIGAAVTVVFFRVMSVWGPELLRSAGVESWLDPAGLPLLGVCFTLFSFVTQPFMNWISRIFERQADRMAVAVTGNHTAFVSTMEKLAAQNLSDRNPSWLIKVFFFDHPPVDERIAYTAGVQAKGK